MQKYVEYISYWHQQREEERLQLEKLWEKAQQIAKRCALVLAKKYGVKKVYAVGSLAEPQRFHFSSDIDLAVEGLKSHLYFSALKDVWKLLPAGMELDLIPLEDISQKRKNFILSRGKLIYEKQV